MTDNEKATAVAMLLEYLRTHGVGLDEALQLLRPEAVRYWFEMKGERATRGIYRWRTKA